MQCLQQIEVAGVGFMFEDVPHWASNTCWCMYHEILSIYLTLCFELSFYCLCRPSKDPRFEATIGGKQFNKDAFAKRYSFLYNDVIPQERARLKELLKVAPPAYFTVAATQRIQC